MSTTKIVDHLGVTDGRVPRWVDRRSVGAVRALLEDWIG